MPYLTTDRGEPALNAAGLKRAGLVGRPVPRVGLCWGGNTQQLNDYNRSVAGFAARIARLLRIRRLFGKFAITDVRPRRVEDQHNTETC